MTVESPDLIRAHDLDDALWQMPRHRPAIDLFRERREALIRAVDLGVSTQDAADALRLLPSDVVRILRP